MSIDFSRVETKEQKLARLSAEKMATLRHKRNGLLSESDKHVLSDRWSMYSDSTKDAWSTYRQALRDLPSLSPDPENPMWPSMPA